MACATGVEKVSGGERAKEGGKKGETHVLPGERATADDELNGVQASAD